MNEKKLTDEDVVKALECCSKSWDCNNCKRNKENNNRFICSENLLKDCLDLIHRLQAENEQLKDEKEEIRLFNLSIQNGEVDMRIESEMAKSFYNSIIQIFEQAVKDTAKEILDEVSKHYGGAWLVELYKKYSVEV